MSAIGARSVKTTWKYFDRQKIFYPRLHPVLCCAALTLRTIPVAAGVVGDVLVVTLGARRHMPANGGGAAILDGGHDLQLWQVQVTGVVPAIGSTMGAVNIRNLQFGARHGRPIQPEPASRVTSRSSGLVTSWIVLVATFV